MSILSCVPDYLPEYLAQRAWSILAVSSDVSVGLLGTTRQVRCPRLANSGDVLAPVHHLAGECAERLIAGQPSPLLDLWACDVSPVPQRDRDRGRVHLRGRVELVEVFDATGKTVPELFAAFVPETVELHLGVHATTGARRDLPPITLPLSLYRRAGVDPLVGWEARWTEHLAREHGAEVRELARARFRCAASDVAVPLRADRHGVTVRVYRGADACDVLLPFGAPVASPREAVAAFDAMRLDGNNYRPHVKSPHSQSVIRW